MNHANAIHRESGRRRRLFAALAALAAAVSHARAQEVAPPLHGVEIVGATAVPTETLRAAAGAVSVGRPGGAETVRAAVEAVLAIYRQKGFSLTQIAETDVLADGILRLRVAESRIRRVVVRGNQRTREATIRAALSVRPGELYRDVQVQEDRTRLARLGIFADVSVAPRGPGAADEPAGAPESREKEAAPDDEIGLVDIVVRVKEQQTGNVAATVGYGDATGLIGFVDLSENNVLGTGQRVALQWQRTARVIALDDGTLTEENPRMAFSLSYARPALGARRTAFGVDLYDQNTVFLPFFGNNTETLRTYERRRGAALRVGREMGPAWSLFLTARRDAIGYDAVPDRLMPPAEIGRAAATVAALGFSLQVDRRDAIDSPHRGFLHQLDFEDAVGRFGGDRKFRQARLDLRQYVPLDTRRHGPLVAWRFLGGVSSGDVPLPEQFFLGGFDLLRGYDLFSVYGDRMLLGTAEIRVPLGQGLAGVVFSDVGNAWRSGTPFRPARLRAGSGLGLRFLSPIGPIRFDIAYGSRVQTYISLGQSF